MPLTFLIALNYITRALAISYQTDRSRIVRVHVAGDRVEVSVLLAEMVLRIYSWSLATDIAEKLRLHENSVVEKSMSSRFLPQNAFVIVLPEFGFIVVFNIIRIALDVWLIIERLAVDIPEHALMHRFNRDEIVLRWRVRARFSHRKYKTQRLGAKHLRKIGVPMHALR